MSKLRSFRNRAVRHMTGNHMFKKNDVWEHPKRQKLLKKAKLLPSNTYFERRRGTLRKHLESNRKDLLTKAMSTKKHCYDVNKILWRDQKWIEKGDIKKINNDWFATCEGKRKRKRRNLRG